MASSGRLEIVERSRLEAALTEMDMSMLGIVDEETAAEINITGRGCGKEKASIYCGSQQ